MSQGGKKKAVGRVRERPVALSETKRTGLASGTNPDQTEGSTPTTPSKPVVLNAAEWRQVSWVPFTIPNAVEVYLRYWRRPTERRFQ